MDSACIQVSCHNDRFFRTAQLWRNASSAGRTSSSSQPVSALQTVGLSEGAEGGAAGAGSGGLSETRGVGMMLQALSRNSDTATTVANWPFITFSVKVEQGGRKNSVRCSDVPLIYIMVDPMWILLLEAGVALSLLILVVWWTTRPRKKSDDEDDKDEDNEANRKEE